MNSPAHASEPSHFHTTAWSVVAGAQNAMNDERERCIATLCRRYWKPIYYYMRRRRLSHDDALDYTQEYFATFLEKDFVAAADRERGRFRTFVLVTVNRFLSKQLAKRKRRDAKYSIHIKIDGSEEEMILPEVSHNDTAEDDFNRRWALSLLDATLERMREECSEGRKKMYYEAFRMLIDSQTSPEPKSYREMANELGVSETDITNFLHRGRNVFQKLLRSEIRDSVTTESEVDEEIEALKDYLRR